VATADREQPASFKERIFDPCNELHDFLVIELVVVAFESRSAEIMSVMWMNYVRMRCRHRRNRHQASLLCLNDSTLSPRPICIFPRNLSDDSFNGAALTSNGHLAVSMRVTQAEPEQVLSRFKCRSTNQFRPKCGPSSSQPRPTSSNVSDVLTRIYFGVVDATARRCMRTADGKCVGQFDFLWPQNQFKLNLLSID
jgi:hypothetical protein